MTTQLQYGMGGDRPYSLYYRHSGQTPIGAIVLAGAAGIAVGIVAAFVYAYAVEYIPYAKLRCLATICFGLAVGAVTTWIAKVGKVRSGAVALALVGVVTLVAYSFSWVFWIKPVFDRYLSDRPNFHVTHAMLVTRPVLFVRAVEMLNDTGTWAMSEHDKENTRGTFLTLLWLLEAAGIFIPSIGVARTMLKSDVFCESCRKWCGKAVTLRRVATGDPQQLRASLEVHDFSYVNALPLASGNQFWSLEHQQCRGCNQLHALSVQDTKLVVNKKGQVQQTKSKVLIDKLLLTPEEMAVVANPPVPVAAVPAAGVAGPPPLPGGVAAFVPPATGVPAQPVVPPVPPGDPAPPDGR